MDTPTLSRSLRRPPARASFTSVRWQRSYARWQREYEHVSRTDTENRTLPDALGKAPKAWMTRALLHEDGGGGSGEGGEDVQTEGDKLPRSEIHVDELCAEIARLHEQIALVEAAVENDRATQQRSTVTRGFLWEAERVRMADEIQEMLGREDKAREAAEMAESNWVALEHELHAHEKEQQRPVDAQRAVACSEKAEVERLALLVDEERMARAAEDAVKAAESAEITRLETHVDALEGELEVAKQRKRAARWGELCEAVLGIEQVRVLEDAEIELEASTAELSASAEEWAARHVAVEEAAARHRGESGVLTERARKREIEVEEVLAEFLTVAWRGLSRSASPPLAASFS